MVKVARRLFLGHFCIGLSLKSNHRYQVMLIQIPDIHDRHIFFMLFHQNVEAKYRNLKQKPENSNGARGGAVGHLHPPSQN